MRDQFDALEEEGYALEERRDQAEDDFRDVFESKRRELEDQVDQLREEKFKPMEEAAEALNDEIDGRWVALDDLHEQQGALTGQLEELKKRVRDLDRQGRPSSDTGSLAGSDGQRPRDGKGRWWNRQL